MVTRYCTQVLGDRRQKLDIFGHMPPTSRLVRLRDGVPVYQYRADSDTPPVSVIRADGSLEHGVHIHDFPILWYAHAAGLVYVVAPGVAVDAGRVPAGMTGSGVLRSRCARW